MKTIGNGKDEIENPDKVLSILGLLNS